MRALAILLLAAIAFSAAHALSEEDLLSRAVSVYEELARLRAGGVDVSGLMRELGDSLAAWSTGRMSDSEFSDVLDSLESRIERLRSVSGEASALSALIKYGLLASALATPLIVYFVLPRACAWAWYLPRRRWVIKDEDRQR